MYLYTKYILLLFTILLSAGCTGGVLKEKPTDDNNLIKNPGFENPESAYHWTQRNWWKRKHKMKDGKTLIETNEYSFELDPNQPHSGEYAQKISMTKHINEDLQFLYSLPELKPGMSIRLSFWVRGPANTLPIKVSFRKDAPPWNDYFSSSVALTETWKKHVFNITLPQNTDPKKSVLMFHLNEANTFWLDDVSIIPLPAKESGTIPNGNVLKNGSFEVGKNLWYATFRESGRDVNAPIADERNIDVDLNSVITKDAPNGKRSLKFQIHPKCQTEITSALFPLKYGHETTISFWLKTESPSQKITVGLFSGIFPNMIKETKLFKNTGKAWQKHSFKIKPKPSVGGRYFVDIKAQAPGIYEIDHITVTQGTSRNDEILAPNVGWEAADRNHPANIFEKGEEPRFNILVEAPSGDKEVNLKGRVVDAWEHEIATLNLTVKLDTNGLGLKEIKLPADQYGTFKAELFMADASESEIPSAEILYAVPVKLKEPGDVQNSFFGGHARFTPYNLHIAKKAGFRWLRCHPPNDTKWNVVEPEKGEFSFNLSGVKRAHEMGFKIVGLFQGVPEFYADKQKEQFHSWYRCYPPAGENGWNAWEKYVSATAQSFSPYIKVWEIGNESDGAFLQVPAGQNREEIYLKYVRKTLNALKGSRDLTLIGGVTTGAARPFMNNILKMDVGNYVDALSFHSYETMSMNMIMKRKEEIQHWNSYENRNGEAIPIWHSEGFGAHVSSWLKTTGKAYHESEQLNASALNIQSIICFKQLGVKKHFLYAAYAHKAGRIVHRDECSIVIDKNGLPLPTLSAHAAAVHFLENAVPTELSHNKGVTVASFIKNGRKIDVMWSESVTNLEDASNSGTYSNYQCYDMMGNPIEIGKDTKMGKAPIYFIENK